MGAKWIAYFLLFKNARLRPKNDWSKLVKTCLEVLFCIKLYPLQYRYLGVWI